MSFELHPNTQRGHVDHGWLKAAHSFSFASYFNRERMNFGALLVLNEDVVQPGAGFGEHPHDNMEIVTLPLSGALRHGDSMGNSAVIQAGDAQIMSAGTGIVHSERNASETDPVHLLQIWIAPNQRGLPTRYDQLTVKDTLVQNKLSLIVAPEPTPGALLIHQDAWFWMGHFDAGQAFDVTTHHANNGLFAFVIRGSATIQTNTLGTGDALAIKHEQNVHGITNEPSTILFIEVPLGAF